MKRIAILAGMLMLVASASFAEKGAMNFGVQAGMDLPSGDFGDAAKSGIQGSVFGSYNVAKDCAIGAEFGYMMFGSKVDETLTIAGITAKYKAEFSMMQFGVFSTYNFPMSDPKQKPYVKVGVANYSMKVKWEDSISGTPGGILDFSLSGTDTESKIGFNVGAGYDMEVSPNYTLGLAGAYHMIPTEGSSTSLMTVGLKVGFGMAKQ